VLDADVSFEAAREVVVVVTDPAGAPLSGTYVSGYRRGAGGEGVNGQTDTKGETRLRLGAGEWALNVNWIPQMDPKGRKFLPIVSRVVPQDSSRLVLALQEAGSVAGRVVDGTGSGLAGVVVQVFAEGKPGTMARTDAEGRFNMDVAPGAPVMLRVIGRRAPDQRQAESWTGEASGVAVGTTDVVLKARRLPEDRALTVVARGPDGAPIEGVSVSLWAQSGLSRVDRTGPGGRASFSDLTAEPWTVFVQPDTSHLGVWFPGRAQVDATTAEVDFRFRVGILVEGIVLDADGRPAVNTSVDVLGPASDVPSLGAGGTNSEGRFHFVIDPDARLPLKIRATGARGAVVSDLTLLPAEGLTLRLVGGSRPR
jgi:hypothetical protein